MKRLTSLLTVLCCLSIAACSALAPEEQTQLNRQLFAAAVDGDLQAVQQALAAGADIHDDDDLLLCCAARNGHLAVVRFLVEHGADIHAYDDYALRWAAERGHWAVVQYLVRHGAERAVLSENQLYLLYQYIKFELQTALGRDDWHKVEELLSIVHVQELPHYSQQHIRAILVPAVENKLDSVRLELFTGTHIRNTDLALRILSFIIGPHTRAAFIYFIKEDTHEITQ